MSRRRFIYRKNEETGEVESIEVSPDFQTVEARTPNYTDSFMDGARATDGTDIGSRAKRRAYMKANNLADSSDYRETWARAAKEREAAYSGNYDRDSRREAIQRAIHQRGQRR